MIRLPLERAALVAGIAAVVICFSFIYGSLWGFVGRFPAESVPVSRPDAASAVALCFHPDFTARDIALDARGHRGRAMLTIPLTGRPESDAELGRISGSRSLFYAFFDRTIYVVDALEPADVVALRQLAFWRLVDPNAVQRSVTGAAPFAPPCLVPSTDRGITEAYWATKGTAVLHHWSFLYDGSIHDGKPVHAQYGTLVSGIARAVAVALHTPGPTGFVRAAWVVFWFTGLLAIGAFLFAFRENLFIAIVGLAAQVCAFTSLYAFSILLAPGYHWSRELVMLLPAVVLSLAAVKRGGRPISKVAIAIASVVLAAAAYLLDPSFALADLAAIGVAAAVRYQSQLRANIATRPAQSALAGGFVVVVVAVLFVVDRSNLSYVMTKAASFTSAAFVDPARTPLFLMNVGLAIVALGLVATGRLGLKTGYVAVFSMIAYTFYVITPDQFHFAKYVAYVVPLYVALGIAISEHVLARCVPDGLPIARILLVLWAFALLANAMDQLTFTPPEWQLRIVDSLGLPYFTSSPVEINGRLIDANINQRTVERLRRFPATTNTDLIVSPLDKYILFLYDEHNGFDSVDATAWMDTDSKLRAVEAAITARHARLLIDTSVYTVDPAAGILNAHPIVGSVNSQSKLDLQARLRMSELAAFVSAHCSTGLSNTSDWLPARC